MTAQPPTDRDLLEFEGKFFRHYGAKETAIRDEFDLTAARYYQLIVDIIRDPDPELATEFGPLIARLRRLLDTRLAQKLPRSA